MFASSSFKVALVSALLFTLVACKSTEEQAEEYFESGVALIASGDTDRAIVEFRNVFELAPTHLEARKALAELMLAKGNRRGAYGQYLTLAEQYPENIDARRTLAEIAFAEQSWDEFDRHGAVAVELDSADPRIQAIGLGLQYRDTILGDDAPAREALIAPTEALLAQLPDNVILNNLLIDNYTRAGRLGKALERLDAVIESDPLNKRPQNQRLALLAQMQDFDRIEEQLQNMVQLFPEDSETKSMLLRFYVARAEVDKAENFLRDISDPAADDATYFVDLIRFVAEIRGEEAARKEIETAIAVNPEPDKFRTMRAMLDFQAGEQDKAVADMEAIIEARTEPSDELDVFKITLARMISTTGNQVGARRLVEEVLANNTQQIDALKMQAAWQLQEDETDAAISSLRLALDVAPEDVQAMNLMAEAYFRTGNKDLARDFLSLAVSASGNAPEAALRYATLLIGEERYLPAEDVLLSSLRLNPNEMDLLNTLGELYLVMEDEARATQVIDTLSRLEDERATTMANRLQVALLEQSNGTEEAVRFLEELANSETGNLRDRLALVQARLAVGETEESLTLMQAIVDENPDNDFLRFALATSQAANGDLETSETTLRDLAKDDPTRARVWMEISKLRARQGDVQGAEQALVDGLAATPEDANLLWAQASTLERNGDIDGAIEIYQGLYERNTSAEIIANNLASLLATYRDDDESLERAWTLARRLRDSEISAFQDTYGWITFRRGDIEDSLPYLEQAAAGLPSDPVVQVHLGLNYAALGRTEEALTQLQKAIDLAGPADTRPKIEEARSEVARLRELDQN